MRADAKANRAALIEAAKRLYARHGGPVPFTAVATEAGVGAGTLYRHFPTQTDLIVGLSQSVRDDVVATCERWLEVMESDPEAAWRAFIGDLVDLHLSAFLPALGEEQVLDELMPRLAETRQEMLAAAERIVAGARAAGLVDASADAAHVVGGIGVVTRPLPRLLEELMPELTTWLVDRFIDGLRPTSAT